MGLVLTNLGELDRARQHQQPVASEDQDIDRPDEARLNARNRIYFANLALVELVAGRAESRKPSSVRFALDPAHPSAFRRHGILGMALMAQGTATTP